MGVQRCVTPGMVVPGRMVDEEREREREMERGGRNDAIGKSEE